MAETFNALKKAVETKDPDGFEEALNACSTEAPCNGLCELLTEVLLEDWHFRHEDVAWTIQQLKCKGAVRALEQRALDTPEYLEWDDNYAFARKCTWALADIGTADARQALERLSNAEIPAVRKFAQKRLDQWHLELDRKGG